MIKQGTIEEIISSCRIEEVVGDFVLLKKRGVNYIGHCPFHDEKTPSFVVSPARGICKCFGCGEGGNSVSFVMKHEKYSFQEALRYLAKKYNIEIEEVVQTSEEIKNINLREALFAVLAFAQSFFSKNLSETEEGKSIGLTYFKERGFSEEIIKKFQLGYSLQDRESFFNAAKANGFIVENLEKAGMVVSKTTENGDVLVRDRFSERVIFPISNFSGKVIGFGGRTLSTDKKTAKYINSPETEVYHKSDVLYGIFQAKNAIRKEDKCYLVEGYTDVISLFQTGIENVVASSGTSLTTGQIKQIKKLTNNVTVLYDGDSAGQNAAIRAIGMLLKEDLNLRIILLPPNEDPDSFARQNNKAEILDYFLANEKDFIQFKIDLSLKEIENDPIKKAEFINQIADDIASIPDPLTRSLFIEKCGTLLNVKEEILMHQVNKITIKNYRDKKEKENRQEVKEKEQQTQEVPKIVQENFEPLSIQDIEKYILSLFLNYGNNVIAEDKNVSQYLLDDFIREEFEFTKQEYQTFFKAYKEILENFPDEISKKMELHPEEEIRTMYLSFIDIKPLPSPLWESSKIKSYINTIDNNKVKLHEELIRVLERLRLVKLRQIRGECQEKLVELDNEEEITDLLLELQNYNRVICEIEKKLGVTYR